MNKDKSGLWNASFGEIGATLKMLQDQGLDLEAFAKLRSDEKLVKKVVGFINQSKDLEVVSDTEMRLIVDYTKSLKQMIADGKYDWKNKNITEKNFPIPKEVKGKKVEISTKLFHFNHNISSEDAEKEIDKDGFRSATLFEQQAFAQKHPELQRQFPIVALGSVWRNADDGHRVPCLGVYGDRRGLDLRWFDRDWYADYRFLAVRK